MGRSVGRAEPTEVRTIYVHTDHNPDDVRSFYEIPDALARRVQPTGDRRTFTQCLADMFDLIEPWEGDDTFWNEDEELRS